MNRKPMRRVSKKRAKEDRQRSRLLHDHYGQHPRCEACPVLEAERIFTGCNGWADDAHEVLRRSAGGSITDLSGILAVGRRCHDWIGANGGPEGEATRLRLCLSRYGGFVAEDQMAPVTPELLAKLGQVECRLKGIST